MVQFTHSVGSDGWAREQSFRVRKPLSLSLTFAVLWSMDGINGIQINVCTGWGRETVEICSLDLLILWLVSVPSSYYIAIGQRILEVAPFERVDLPLQVGQALLQEVGRITPNNAHHIRLLYFDPQKSESSLTVNSFLLFSNSASSALVSCWALDILAAKNRQDT